MGKYDSYVNAEGIRISKATGKTVRQYKKLNAEYWTMREDITPGCPPSQVADPIVEELKRLYSDDEIKGIIGLKKRCRTYRTGRNNPKRKERQRRKYRFPHRL